MDRAMKNEKNRERVLVLSGGSTGIGRETALCFAHEGYRVFELSRTGHSEDGIIHMDTDVTDPKSVDGAMKMIAQQADGIDLLICNAGYGISGAIEYTDPCDAKRQFDVNFFGTALMIQNALPMLRQKQGRILCIGSVAGIIPVPFQAYYSASKAAVAALCEALRNEIAPFHIDVSCILLGNVRTGFTSSRQKSQQGEELYQGRISRSVAVMEDEEKNGMEPSHIAARLLRIAGCRRLRPFYTVGFVYRIYALLVRLLPRRWVHAIVGYLYAR